MQLNPVQLDIVVTAKRCQLEGIAIPHLPAERALQQFIGPKWSLVQLRKNCDWLYKRGIAYPYDNGSHSFPALTPSTASCLGLGKLPPPQTKLRNGSKFEGSDNQAVIVFLQKNPGSTVLEIAWGLRGFPYTTINHVMELIDATVVCEVTEPGQAERKYWLTDFGHEEAARIVSKSGTKVRRKHKLTPADLKILQFVNGHGEVTASEVARGIGIVPNSANSRMKVLTEAGFLSRRPVGLGGTKKIYKYKTTKKAQTALAELLKSTTPSPK